MAASKCTVVSEMAIMSETSIVAVKAVMEMMEIVEITERKRDPKRKEAAATPEAARLPPAPGRWRDPARAPVVTESRAPIQVNTGIIRIVSGRGIVVLIVYRWRRRCGVAERRNLVDLRLRSHGRWRRIRHHGRYWRLVRRGLGRHSRRGRQLGLGILSRRGSLGFVSFLSRRVRFDKIRPLVEQAADPDQTGFAVFGDLGFVRLQVVPGDQFAGGMLDEFVIRRKLAGQVDCCDGFGHLRTPGTHVSNHPPRKTVIGLPSRQGFGLVKRHFRQAQVHHARDIRVDQFGIIPVGSHAIRISRHGRGRVGRLL